MVLLIEHRAEEHSGALIAIQKFLTTAGRSVHNEHLRNVFGAS